MTKRKKVKKTVITPVELALIGIGVGPGWYMRIKEIANSILRKEKS